MTVSRDKSLQISRSLLAFIIGLITELIERTCLLNVENVNVIWTVFVIYVDNSQL